MTLRETARQLEDVQIIAEKADSILLAVSEAVCGGDYSPENYRWAFDVLTEMTGNVKKKLGEMGDSILEELQKEGN